MLIPPSICIDNSALESPPYCVFLAVRVGFEPTVHCCITGFQDQLLKPLGHLTKLYGHSVNIIAIYRVLSA